MWRFFPLWVVAGLGLVVVVNAGMIYAALSTFPGQAGEEDFALSNHYDAVLDREQREAALGWSVVAVTDAAGRPEVTLTDRNGAPLNGASVAASAERPLGRRSSRRWRFAKRHPGIMWRVPHCRYPDSGS